MKSKEQAFSLRLQAAPLRGPWFLEVKNACQVFRKVLQKLGRGDEGIDTGGWVQYFCQMAGCQCLTKGNLDEVKVHISQIPRGSQCQTMLCSAASRSNVGSNTPHLWGRGGGMLDTWGESIFLRLSSVLFAKHVCLWHFSIAATKAPSV